MKVVFGFPVVLLLLIVAFWVMIPLALLDYFDEIIDAKNYLQGKDFDSYSG